MMIRITGKIPYLKTREDAISEINRLEEEIQELGEISCIFEQPNRFSKLRKHMKDIVETLDVTYPE